MAFVAKDGSKHTNIDSSKRASAKHMASMPAPASAPSPDGQGGPPPITSDPEAMQCVQMLQQKGYTADDVELAMGGGDDQQAQAAPPPAAGAPGMM